MGPGFISPWGLGACGPWGLGVRRPGVYGLWNSGLTNLKFVVCCKISRLGGRRDEMTRHPKPDLTSVWPFKSNTWNCQTLIRFGIRKEKTLVPGHFRFNLTWRGTQDSEGTSLATAVSWFRRAGLACLPTRSNCASLDKILNPWDATIAPISWCEIVSFCCISQHCCFLTSCTKVSIF